MRPIVARPDGELEVLGGFRPAARSGGRLVKLEATATIPLPEGTTLMHLPGRRALALDAWGRPLRLNAPWWFWNLFGEQAVFLLSRRGA